MSSDPRTALSRDFTEFEVTQTGHSMVPCIDMANHASSDSTNALYETDTDGNAILILRDDRDIAPNDEVTITYGDEKGACEMLFSYGFIEETVKSARELFLDLDIPDDDPLKLAKKVVAQSAPGFRLFLNDDSTDWESSFIWLLCVNEEDGLEFKLLQNTDGERELQASWKDKEFTDMSVLIRLLKLEPLWDVFELRAIATLYVFSQCIFPLLNQILGLGSFHSLDAFQGSLSPL